MNEAFVHTAGVFFREGRGERRTIRTSKRKVRGRSHGSEIFFDPIRGSAAWTVRTLVTPLEMHLVHTVPEGRMRRGLAEAQLRLRSTDSAVKGRNRQGSFPLFIYEQPLVLPQFRHL